MSSAQRKRRAGFTAALKAPLDSPAFGSPPFGLARPQSCALICRTNRVIDRVGGPFPELI